MAEAEWPEGGIWTHAQWADRVNRGIEKTMVFIAEDSVPLSINGVVYYTERGREIELPLPFYYLYVESRKAQGQTLPNAMGALNKRAFGPGTTSVTSGWNGNVASE